MFKTLEIKEDILSRNDDSADRLRAFLKGKNVFLLNVMASPGSGKTTLLLNLVNRLKDKFRIAVLEADIDSDVDAKVMEEISGVSVIQMHTGGACHLTAQMVREALIHFDLDNLDLIFLENVGNLVCPAEFDTGSNINMMLLSVPEGDDKPLKYPLMFEVSKIAVITKIDTLPIFDFDIERCKKNIKMRNKDASIFTVSALKDEGVDTLSDYLAKIVKEELGH